MMGKTLRKSDGGSHASQALPRESCVDFVSSDFARNQPEHATAAGASSEEGNIFKPFQKITKIETNQTNTKNFKTPLTLPTLISVGP